MNNTSSTVLNFTNVAYSMRSCAESPCFISISFFTIIFLYIVPKPKLYLYKFFTIIFLYIVPKPKLYLYKFFTIIFPYGYTDISHF